MEANRIKLWGTTEWQKWKFFVKRWVIGMGNGSFASSGVAMYTMMVPRSVVATAISGDAPMVRVPTESGHRFQSYPATDSDLIRPPIPT